MARKRNLGNARGTVLDVVETDIKREMEAYDRLPYQFRKLLQDFPVKVDAVQTEELIAEHGVPRLYRHFLGDFRSDMRRDHAEAYRNIDSDV